MGQVYLNQGKIVEGYTLFYNATRLNERNADIWYNLAIFARALGELNVSDAGFAAVKAIEFSYDNKRKLAIAGEFAVEIKYLSQQNP